MSRFNQVVKTGVQSPVHTLAIDPAGSGFVRTAQGGEGFLRDPKSELFTLAVSYMASEQNDFYETAKSKDNRFVSLLAQVAPDVEWSLGFVSFLRTKANLRTASVIAAAEIVKARLALGLIGNRDIISAALQRPDEPGELIAYWFAKYGKNLPKPVKRGISDAAERLFHERSYLKYSTDSKGIKFSDVLQIVHAEAKDSRQNTLYKHILDKRYDQSGEGGTPQELTVLRAHAALMDLPVPERRTVTAGQLAEAGMTWEALAGWLQGPMDAAAWEKIIPSMGAMALLRNLRNFDQVGINKAAKRLVEDKLTDQGEIVKSRLLPMRFLSAYRATRDSGTVTGWAPLIEEGLNLSLANVPELDGRTLILVDLSGSMGANITGSRTDLSRRDGAAVFGAALWKRSANADIYGFDNQVYQFNLPKTASVLPVSDTIASTGGGGTATGDALQATYAGHDRVIILTDEQAGYGWGHGRVPLSEALGRIKVPVYTWNLGGYQVAHAESGKAKRHTFAGLSDASFRMIPLLEAGQSQDWKKLFS